MSFPVTPTGDLVLDASETSRKVANIRQRPSVAVVLGCTGDVSVQVEGDAVVEQDAARAQAAAVYGQWFPGSRALAPGFAVVRIAVRWVRSYDTTADPARVVEGPPRWG